MGRVPEGPGGGVRRLPHPSPMLRIVLALPMKGREEIQAVAGVIAFASIKAAWRLATTKARTIAKTPITAE